MIALINENTVVHIKQKVGEREAIRMIRKAYPSIREWRELKEYKVLEVDMTLDDKVKKVVNVVSKHADIPVKSIIDFNTLRGVETIVRARQMAIYFLSEHYYIGSTILGRQFGKDHSTVIYSRKAIADRIDIDWIGEEDLKFIFELCKAELIG